MAKFTDCLGRVWEFRITLAMLPKLRAAGFDVGSASRGVDGFAPLADPESLGRVLWLLCEAQATAKAVTEETFADGFDGPTIAAATDAMVECVVDFTQRPAAAKVVKARLPGEIAKAEAEAIRQIETILSGSIDSAGNSPASAVSTPAS